MSNRDIVSTSALASKYLEIHNKIEPPISTLEFFENEFIDSENIVEMNANIAVCDVANEKDGQHETISGDNTMIPHEKIINEATNGFDVMIRIRREYSSQVLILFQNEESLDDTTASSKGTIFDDAVTDMHEGLETE